MTGRRLNLGWLPGALECGFIFEWQNATRVCADDFDPRGLIRGIRK